MSSDPLFPTSLLDSVGEGMTVIDEHGRRLGTVARVHLGEPEAAPADVDQEDVGLEEVVLTPLANPGGSGTTEPSVPLVDVDEDMPEEMREELLRAGFIVVEGPDVHGIARYVSANHLVEVTGDTVRVRTAPHLRSTGAPG